MQKFPRQSAKEFHRNFNYNKKKAILYKNAWTKINIISRESNSQLSNLRYPKFLSCYNPLLFKFKILSPHDAKCIILYPLGRKYERFELEARKITNVSRIWLSETSRFSLLYVRTLNRKPGFDRIVARAVACYRIRTKRSENLSPLRNSWSRKGTAPSYLCAEKNLVRKEENV